MKKMLLIDAFAVIHRAFHALPDFKSPQGELVNIIYGFVSTLIKAVREVKPDFVVIAFDLVAPTFRHELFKEYKAQRPETPSGMAEQIPLVKELVQTLGLPILAREGYEAEDLIATVIAQTDKKAQEYVIVTGDQDTLQLASPTVKIYFMRRGLADLTLLDDQGVKDFYGVSPAQVIDVKALRGDPSDNIPGIAGVGAKTAVELVQQYGSVENIFANLGQLPPKFVRLLEGKKKEALLSKKLVTIKNDAPLKINLADFVWTENQLKRLLPLLERLGMQSLIKRLREAPEFDQPVKSKIVQESLL